MEIKFKKKGKVQLTAEQKEQLEKYNRIADHEMTRGNYKQAVVNYDRALTIDEMDWKARQGAGLCAVFLTDYGDMVVRKLDDLINDLAKVLESAETLDNMIEAGNRYLATKEKRIVGYKKSVIFKHFVPRILLRYANICFRVGDAIAEKFVDEAGRSAALRFWKQGIALNDEAVCLYQSGFWYKNSFFPVISKDESAVIDTYVNKVKDRDASYVYDLSFVIKTTDRYPQYALFAFIAVIVGYILMNLPEF